MGDKPLDKVIAEHIAAVNAFRPRCHRRHLRQGRLRQRRPPGVLGIDGIRAWAERELVRDKATMDVREVVDNYGDTIVRAAYDGEYDKTNLPPGELILSSYFGLRDGRITSLIVVRNEPAVLK